MFWGCFSYHGVGPLVPVEGMMKSDQYENIITERMKPELEKRFSSGNGIFQQDLAPCHTSKKMKEYFARNRVNVLDWPGNSPDLNPIENLWAICKQRLAKMDCRTKNSLICSIIKVWYRDEKILENCKTLVESMPKRVKLVLLAKGGHIAY